MYHLSVTELQLQLWGPVGIQPRISHHRCKVIAFLSPRNTQLFFRWKHLTSHGVPAGPKLCHFAYLLINIYIFFTFTPLCWQVMHLSIQLQAKQNPYLKNINLSLSHILFIYLPHIRGVNWFEWRSIRQGAKHSKFAAPSAGTDSACQT